MTKKNAILYLRVSDKSQIKDGHSFEEQEPMLRALAEREGYRVVKIFKDKAISGTSTKKRDGFKAAEAFIAEQNKDPDRRKVQAMIAWHWDRVARNERDYLRFRDEVLIKYGVKLITKSGTSDYESPEGLWMDVQQAGLSAYWSRMIGKKVREMGDQLAPQGHTLHKAPLGYKNCRKEVNGKTVKYVELDDETALLVKKMFQMYSLGNYSLADIAKHMSEKEGLLTKHGNNLAASTIGDYLNNTYYKGKVKRNGKEYKGKHPRLISDALFKKCQDVLAEQRHHASRKQKPSNHKLFYLKDALKCGVCGYRCTGGGSKGSNRTFNYYYCGRNTKDPKYHSKKGGNCIDLTTLHQEVEAFFSLFQLSDDIVEEVKQRAEEILDETHSDHDSVARSLRETLKNSETLLQNLERKWLAEDVSDEFYHRNHDAIEGEIETIEARLAELSEERVDRTELFESLVKLAKDMETAYRKAKPNVRRMYLKIFWDYFKIQKGGIEQAVPSKAVIALVNEGLIKLKRNSQKRRVLIGKVWLLGLDSNQQPSR